MNILIIEDNQERINLFREWMDADCHPVFIKSAGIALGGIKRDRGHVYAGVCLDHDLVEQVSVAAEKEISGTQVIQALIQYFNRDTLILVHSMNYGKGPEMVGTLSSHGFPVTRIPMIKMTEELFKNWLAECRENWEACQDI